MGALTQAELTRLLHYDPSTGVFVRKVRTCNKVKVGDVAGNETSRGYRNIRVSGRLYQAHRLAWLYITGAWPEYEIDHIDNNKKNNAFANLRDVNRSINLQNVRQARGDNKSGFLGVSAKNNKFIAQIKVFGKVIHLGYFPTPTAAHAAYLEEKRRLHVGCTI